MHSVLVHDYYSRLDPNAVFVIVDTSLKSGQLDIKAHIRLVVLVMLVVLVVLVMQQNF